MGAFVEHEFTKGFILDEGRVRKLHEIISERISRLKDAPAVKFKVFRGDSYSYETTDINAVLAEDNNDWRAITHLGFLVDIKDVLEFNLGFSDKSTTLRIVGDDRDVVFLLFSDVREYVTKEVLARRKITKDTSRSIGIILMLIATLGMMWSLYSQIRPDPQGAASAMESSELSVKLNYLRKV